VVTIPRVNFVRRFAALFLIGSVHLLFIWNRDIIALYAVCGLLVFSAVRLPSKILVVAGVLVMYLPEVVPFGMPFVRGEAGRALSTRAREVYGGSDLASMFVFRWEETKAVILPVSIAILPRTCGVMLLGMAAWKSGVLAAPREHGRLLIAALTGAIAVTAISRGESLIGMATAYVSALLVALRDCQSWMSRRLSAVGQMALTNYLTQPVMLTFTLYGYGRGLFGRTGHFATVLFALQMEFSLRWLRHFRFGPVEWLWRSVTYGLRQPFV
jgi:uncharacterized protein